MKKMIIAVLIFLFFIHGKTFAYSVLTHMAIIDSAWESSLKPLLIKKFPGAQPEELKKAYGYVYGGAIMPDMGYYPFSNPFFTNLVHYVRSGSFVECLIKEAQDINEYAFALGALCHYYADVYGHAIGVNPAVPLVYTKLQEKYGDTVYYEQDKISHLRLEFGQDVLQTARGNYASEKYHDFIGFRVSRPVLERAFLKTYGIDLNDVIKNYSISVGTFRWTVKNFFPVITRVAWANKRDEIKKMNPGATKKTFRFRMSRKTYYSDKGDDYKPGFLSGTFGWLIKVLPKIGPLRAFNFKVPNAAAEKLFFESFKTVLYQYSGALAKLPEDSLQLVNKDFDTGKKSEPGEYVLADNSIHSLLMALHNNDFKNLTPQIKSYLIDYYSRADSVVAKRSCKKQRKINCSIQALLTSETIAESTVRPLL